MSLRAQRGNPVAASTNVVASFRLSPNVIASAAWQSRSHIDQRGRQLPIVPQCHCDRSVAISQPHRPTPSPDSGLPPNVIASAARQSRNRIDFRNVISDTRPFHHRVVTAFPISCIQSGNPDGETSARLAFARPIISNKAKGFRFHGQLRRYLQRCRVSVAVQFPGPERAARRVSPPPHAAPSLTDLRVRGKRAGHGSLGQNLHLLAVSPTAPETLCSTESRFQPNPQSRRICDRNSHPLPNRKPILPAITESQNPVPCQSPRATHLVIASVAWLSREISARPEPV